MQYIINNAMNNAMNKKSDQTKNNNDTNEVIDLKNKDFKQINELIKTLWKWLPPLTKGAVDKEYNEIRIICEKNMKKM